MGIVGLIGLLVVFHGDSLSADIFNLWATKKVFTRLLF